MDHYPARPFTSEERHLPRLVSRPRDRRTTEVSLSLPRLDLQWFERTERPWESWSRTKNITESQFSSWIVKIHNSFNPGLLSSHNHSIHGVFTVARRELT